MTFLRSYEGFFAGADVSLDSPGCERLPLQPSAAAPPGPALQGWWPQRVSTPFTVTWATAADGGGEGASEQLQERAALPAACHLQRGRTYALNITLRRPPVTAAGGEGATVAAVTGPADRFKLLRVAACGMFVRQDQPCCR